MAQTIALAISRQLASGGEPIGRLVAKRLGFTYLNRLILKRAAEYLQEDAEVLRSREERPLGFVDKLVQLFAASAPMAGMVTFPCPPCISDRHLFEVEAQIIRDVAASRDVVVMGRAGFSVLSAHPGLASVFIKAPRLLRAETLRQGGGLENNEQALAMIDDCDKDRGDFVRSMTGVHWTDAANYHLCLDTGKLDHQTCADIIVTLVERVRAGLSA